MALKRILTSDKNIQLIQDNVEEALIPLQVVPMVKGTLIDNVVLTAGQDNLIQHTLGRFPKIFFIGNLDANSVVWNPPSPAIMGQKYNSSVINLRCSSSCTVSLWIN